MALSTNDRFAAAGGAQDGDDSSLSIFTVERVQLQFSISSEFVAAQVANNVIVLALATGRILRIDLDSPADIDDIDLPKKPSEVGLICRMFLDPSASHLVISTTLGENFYLHTQSRQPKALSKLKGVGIECVGWNPSMPTASTREILIGSADGNVYETYIEQSNEFYRREEKYMRNVYRTAAGPVTGLWVDVVDGRSDMRRVLLATQANLQHFVGKIARQGQEGSGSIFSKFFETETPTTQERIDGSAEGPSMLAVSPEPDEAAPAGDDGATERSFAWLSGQGVFHGKLQGSSQVSSMGSNLFESSNLFVRSNIPNSETAGGRRRVTREPIESIALTQWHILSFVEGRLVAANRLDERIVYDQVILEKGATAVALLADHRKNTFWLFSKTEIFEIVVTDEDRDVWKIMLKDQKFDAASRYAKGPAQKDAVATASGDYLIKKNQFLEAASVFGKSSKPFEQVALTFIDYGEHDALRRYLTTKLSTYKKSFLMQRTMIASWLVEIFMTKLNTLDDTITTKAELVENTNTSDSKNELATVRSEFRDFVSKFKGDLDPQTTYEIISSHGREQELLTYATTINDYSYVLSYWVQRERWAEALDVLKKQTEPKIFYEYSSVLMSHVPTELVDILMRHPDLNPRNLIPALLNYSQDGSAPLAQNQAARYLLFCVNQLTTTDAAVHNTLISIYASSPSDSEAALMSYLTSQATHPPPSYDADFALRLCIQHNRVQSCVHIYSLMGQYASAVALALKHDDIALATEVADRPGDSNPALRKKLWLAIAKKVIQKEGTGSIKTAIEYLKRCDLLRIEDLIPFFPDFVVIDDFKDEICAALEKYSRDIDNLKTEMDESAATAESIKEDIKQLDMRYVLIEPGEGCRVCTLPLLSRQFFVFPSCQHGFHTDCLGKKVVEGSGLTTRGRIRELQASIGRGISGPRRDREVKELDGLVGKECILCGDFAIKLIEEPFIHDSDNKNEWAV
ncbi:hypothetical protein MMC25_000565 [Agyrium rufum]|nr:hypothetical protein [Agyrium rufum]